MYVVAEIGLEELIPDSRGSLGSIIGILELEILWAARDDHLVQLCEPVCEIPTYMRVHNLILITRTMGTLAVCGWLPANMEIRYALVLFIL